MMLPLNYSTLRLFLDGMMAMMLVYIVISYAWHRKPVYILYGLYIGSMLAYLQLNDLFHYYMDNGASARRISLAVLAENTVQCITFFIYGRFAILLMDLRRSDPVSVLLINAIAGLSAIAMLVDVGCFVGNSLDHPLRETFQNISRYVLAFCALATVPRVLRLRNPVVSFFIWGTFFYVAGAILALVMYQCGWASRVPDLPFTFPMVPMEIGIIIETICFSLGLSLQNRQTEREKIRAQSQLIHQLRENEAKQNRLNAIRDEIARDLHDEMGSQLSSISIMSQVTAQLLPPNDRARHRMVAIGETARQTMDSMREIVWSLNSNSESLQNVGLRIRETVYALFDGTDTHIEVSMPDLENPDLGQSIALTNKQRRDLFLIAKESLTNIVQHANAQHVRLQFNQNANALMLTITDDGVGFNLSQIGTGLGMSNIRQRAAQLGGQLTIDSELGLGTTVRLRYPALVGEESSEYVAADVQLVAC